MSIFLHRALAWVVCIAGLCAGQGQAAEPDKHATKPGDQSSSGTKGDTATMAVAATAALRDSDPTLNGTVKEATRTSSTIAKRRAASMTF
jgi:hypothetical protein